MIRLACALAIGLGACGGGGSPRLTFLAAELSDEQRAELATLAPNVRVLDGLTPDQAMSHAHEANGIDARYATPELLERAPHLTWIHSPTVGVDRLLAIRGVADDRIVVTNPGAASAPAVADHAIFLMLALAPDVRAWGGRTALVLGLGNTGGEIARRARRLGMRVIAIRKTPAPAPDLVDHVAGPDELAARLSSADVVFVALPLTPETRGLLDADALAAMKPGAYLVNVARGPIVVTPALVDALASGRLRGAGLDVTDPEPLPPDHPLRRMPRVILTPHVAGRLGRSAERAWEVLRENVRRFGAGEPLLETIDKRAGY